MSNSHFAKLSSYIDALRPIIYVPSFDFHAFDELIREICAEQGNVRIYEYNEGLGEVSFTTKRSNNPYTLCQLLSGLSDTYNEPMFLILKDVHEQLNNPKVISLIKTIASRNIYEESYNLTIFIVCSKLVIPIELEKIITVFDAPLPNYNEIKSLIVEFAKDNTIIIEDMLIDELAFYLKGFSRFEIIQILNLAYQNSGSIERRDLKTILEEKEQIIKKSGILEILNYRETIDDVGGLCVLKKWLVNKSKIFKRLDEAVKFGVDIPKGILIVGMPGCGKSLTAKATANLFDVPLLRLDVGKLLGKYVGESEENLRRAIQTAEAISPCVLWVDEIEKAFSGIGSSNGGHEVTTRLFGYFLTWLQEKTSSVFVVATSNDISKLPAEFLRKGRFDELFFVDFPNGNERKSIFELHIKKRGKWATSIDTIKLIKDTDGYSGADIEAVVKNTVEKAFLGERKHITTDELQEEIKEVKPISVTLKEKIDKLKDSLNSYDIKNAT